jgi:oligopeptide transport system substrate-binding protein
MSRSLVLLLAGIVIVGCGAERAAKPAAKAERTGPKGSIRFSLPSLPKVLDAGVVADVDQTVAVRAVYAAPMRLDDERHPVPDLAESVEFSDDGLQATMRLRAGIEWSDGTPITASDFVDTWNRNLRPTTQSPLAGVMYDVKGAQDVAAGRPGAELGVSIRDERTIEIELERPTRLFLDALTQSPFAPMPAAVRDGASSAGPWSGPYTVASSSIERIELVSNDTYWNEQDTGFAEVELVLEESPENAFALLESGKLNGGINVMSPRGPTAMRSVDGFVLEPGPIVAYVGMRVERPKVRDPRLREAISVALDRSSLAALAPPGVIVPQVAYAPQGLIDSDVASQIEDRPATVKGVSDEQLMARYGDVVPDGLQLDMLTQGAADEVVAETVKQSLQRLGITVRIQPSKDPDSFFDQLGEPGGDFDIFVSNQASTSADVARALAVWRCGGTENDAGFCNSEYDAILDDLEVTTDRDEQQQLVRQAESFITGPDGQHFIAPLAAFSTPIVYGDPIGGATDPTGNFLYLDHLRTRS